MLVSLFALIFYEEGDQGGGGCRGPSQKKRRKGFFFAPAHTEGISMKDT